MQTAQDGHSDEELVDRYRERDQREALETLLDRYLARVRGLAYGMVGDRAEADDLTQEILLRAIRGLPQFKKDAKFGTWLYRVAMNTAYSYLRQRDRRAARQPVELTEAAGTCDDEPSRRMVADETHGQVAAAIAALSPSLRAAVMLMVIEGLPGSEAAAIEGCTPATMYWRLHEARKQLAQRLAGFLDEYPLRRRNCGEPTSATRAKP